MPDYTIETNYHLPVFRHRTFRTDTLEAACRAAVEDDSWDDARHDYESSGETHVTGIWQGANAAYRGPAITIPSQFRQMVQRQAGHFEILLGLLKLLLADVQSKRPTSAEWIAKASWAIARGEAILAGLRDPEGSSEPIDGGEADV
ncbi:hypothetical protein [Sinorhizobium chiapasense]|uniref:dATP/dGTP diphosphohydrolase N-terminal domain-containing protein n=1 Tax=Sinorhizobium chiapasense TaxID=501572 RepID=A0ABZ2BIT3_9HYPH